LVDTLLAHGVNVQKVFAPEHGFRGVADAGEKVNNSVDAKTGLPIVSLYGKNRKPKAAHLAGIEVVLFDIQDVGVRFYTYISTMHLVMEACAEKRIKVMVLDRPNPNGFYVDGPVLEPANSSFVGMHPVPLVHGMTIGEYARMINGEGWLKDSVRCDLTVIRCKGYSHNDFYRLPVKPSPNLPNMAAIYLYPSLGLFEGTVVSVGRGTGKPFQIIGHPGLQKADYTFTPKSVPGAKYPPHQEKLCRGYDLTDYGIDSAQVFRGVNLQWLVRTYRNTPQKASYFLENGFFRLLAGNRTLQQDIKDGRAAAAIRASWREDLNRFMVIRNKYLLYRDFDATGN
ncbi:MAG: DUF1343 domain-containing protein, partial [Bacteroidota bacterium]